VLGLGWGLLLLPLRSPDCASVGRLAMAAHIARDVAPLPAVVMPLGQGVQVERVLKPAAKVPFSHSLPTRGRCLKEPGGATVKQKQQQQQQVQQQQLVSEGYGYQQ
jgi:hypothetical protein